MKADLTRQWRLLDLQQLDTRLAQLAHKERGLATRAELEQAQQRAGRAEEDLVLARIAVSDVDREVTKAGQDTQLVRDRAARDNQRLESGQGSAKDLQALQHELQALARRQGELEEIELEVMERAEATRAELERAEREHAEQTQRITDLQQRLDGELREISTERDSVSTQREQVAAGVGDDLVTLYDRIREGGGAGAAALRQRRCEGCHLELNQVDLGRIRNAPEDEVVRCEECRCILVRTAESGL